MKRRACLLILILLAFGLTCAEGVCVTPNGLVTEELSPEDLKHLVESISVQLLTRQPTKGAICCFDVSPDGLIAIGHSNGENKVVEVLSEKGEFCYGYSFFSNGSFGVKWQENELSIYFIRGDVAAFIGRDGFVYRAVRIQNSAGSNDYLNTEVLSPRKQAGGYIYELRNDMGVLNLFASSYSKLVCIDAKGDAATIYDANFEHMVRTSLLIILWLGFGFVCIITVIHHRGKGQMKMESD